MTAELRFDDGGESIARGFTFVKFVLADDPRPAPSAAQASALADGIVTRSEYEAAVAAYLECGETSGLVANPIPGPGLRVTRPSFQIPDPDGSAKVVANAQAVTSDCMEQHLGSLEAAWHEQNPISPETASEMAAYTEAMESCLAGGVEPSTGRVEGKHAVMFANMEDGPEFT